MSSFPRAIRDNAFIVASVALPLAVVAFFLVASAIPRWTVAPPSYDRLFRVATVYNPARPPLDVEVVVREGRVEATVRATSEASYPQPWTLLLYRADTNSLQEIPIDVRDRPEAGDAPVTTVIEMPGERRVMPDTVAPDGYRFEVGTTRSPGIVGELFGIGRYRAAALLVNGERTVPIQLPAPYSYWQPIQHLGWLEPAAR